MHQVECPIDIIKRHGVGNQVVNIDLAVHIPVDDLGHVSPAPRAAKGAPLPYAAGDELERPGGNFLASFGNTDDDAFTPAAMAAFQRLAHDVRIAGARSEEHTSELQSLMRISYAVFC